MTTMTRTPEESVSYVIEQIDNWVENGLTPLSAIRVVSRQYALTERKVIQLYIDARRKHGVE